MFQILIIDDNPMAVKLLDFLLTANGYETHSALNAEDALNLLKTFQPQLILMDLQLPGIDGLELTRKLKNDPLYKHICIIAITAYAMKGDKEKALEAGCNGYITKPVDVRTLPGIVAEYLKGVKKP